VYLAGGSAGRDFDGLLTSQTSCTSTHQCEGITRITRPDGNFSWQLRIGRGLRLAESPSGEVSWRITKQDAQNPDSIDSRDRYPLSVIQNWHLWHNDSVRREGEGEQWRDLRKIDHRIEIAERGSFAEDATINRVFESTRQMQLASGYSYFQNIYFVNRHFVFVKGGYRLDPSQWAIMSEVESRRRWGQPERFARAEVRGFGFRIIDQNATTWWNRSKAISMEPSIMLTDFLPKFTPHLYHLLENFLGIWATCRSFMVNTTGSPVQPKFLLLPQNSIAEFGESSRGLIKSLFPEVRVIDQRDFRILSKDRIVRFSMMVASDRSAADHGGVNQMITGIMAWLPKFVPSMVSTVLQNLGTSHDSSSRSVTTVTFVDRQSSQNRRLAQELSKSLLWLLGTADPRIDVKWTRFELLSFREQVLRASQTDILMGVHGNGLSHVLWIRKPGALIEIFPGSGNRMLAFQQFCETRGLLYYGLEASSGIVYRDGSCTSLQHDGRWYPPTHCGSLNSATMNQIAADLHLNQVVCLLSDALYSMNTFSHDARRACWPVCAASMNFGKGRNVTAGCIQGLTEYSCHNLGPGYQKGSHVDDETAPNEFCKSNLVSRHHCPAGEFLCEAKSDPGWINYIQGLHNWGLCDKSNCPESDIAKIGWKSFVLSYGMSLPFANISKAHADHKLCVLLPYRDVCQHHNRARVGERAAHLHAFLSHMQDFLMVVGHFDFDFIVLKQTNRGLFNKGTLYNLGVNVAVKRGCDYVALHDIDHVPMDYRNNYSWPDRPIHLCTNSSDVGWERFAGGAVLMQVKHFALINGFSNLYHGWGAEDADLYERVGKIFGNFQRLDPKIGYYMPMKHETRAQSQMTNSGQNSHDLNLKTLHKMKVSKSRAVINIDGYMQMRSHAQVINISEAMNVVTVTADILLQGAKQAECPS